MQTDLQKAKAWLADGTLSRRDFISRASAMGLAVPAALSMADNVLAATPKTGGHFRFGSSSGSTSNTLDPVTFIDWHGYCLGAAVCNFLTEIDPQKQVRPELATAWEANADATRWVFQLRKGVEFHNGKAFTAADVVYSLNRHRGDTSQSAGKPFLASVTSLRADGDHAVVFELSEPNADLPVALSTYQFAIVPDGHDDWTTLIGTGAFTFEAYVPGVRFVAQRNPNYWKPGRGWADTYESIVIADSTARTNALLSGAVDMIDRADGKIVDLVKNKPGVQIIQNPGSSYWSSAMDSRIAPFNDNHVRLAMKYGIDREEILAKVANGYGVVANDHPVPPNDPFFNADLPQKDYDPDRARFHLKQAGLSNLTVGLSAADVAFAGSVDAAQLMRETAKAAGITIDVVREPNDGYWSNVWMQKPFSMVTWGNRATPSLQFEIAYACGAPWADGYLCHDRFETLLKEAKKTTDFDKRKEIFGEMQAIQSDEGANHVFLFDSAVNIFAANVGGAVSDSMAPNMGMRVAERIWMTN